jgi:hypothetical protein
MKKNKETKKTRERNPLLQWANRRKKNSRKRVAKELSQEETILFLLGSRAGS